jgi:hypothetical protein
VFSVPVSLNQIASSGACARADRRTFFAADQRTAYTANYAADNSAFGFAMMMSVRTSVCGYIESCQYQKYNYQKYGHNVLFSYNLYHKNTSA